MGLQGLQKAAAIILLSLGLFIGWFSNTVINSVKHAVVGGVERIAPTAPASTVYNFQDPIK